MTHSVTQESYWTLYVTTKDPDRFIPATGWRIIATPSALKARVAHMEREEKVTVTEVRDELGMKIKERNWR